MRRHAREPEVRSAQATASVIAARCSAKLCRLHGGYLEYTLANDDVRDTDLSHLARFGLRRVPASDGQALMIDEAPAWLRIDGLSDVLRIGRPPPCSGRRSGRSLPAA